MGNVIITKDVPLAKITRPGTTGLFPRKRLFRLLDQGRRNPIVLVFGPPGSGKTSLSFRAILMPENCPAYGIGLTKEMRISRLFFSYMGIAARKATPRKRKPLPLFTLEYLQGISTFTLRYFENLFSGLRLPISLSLTTFTVYLLDQNFMR